MKNFRNIAATMLMSIIATVNAYAAEADYLQRIGHHGRRQLLCHRRHTVCGSGQHGKLHLQEQERRHIRHRG